MKRFCWFGALACLLLAGCPSNTTVKTAGPAADEMVDHASPKMLAVSLHRAIRAKDYNAVAQCIAPEYRKNFAAVLGCCRDYTQEMMQTADLMEKHIGPAPANRLRKEADDLYRALLPSPLAGAVENGKVDWDRVKLETEGIYALFKVDGKYTAFSAKFFILQSGGAWFAAPNEDPDTFAADSKRMVKGYKQFTKILERKQSLLKKGKITAENVEQEFWANAESRPGE